MPSNSSPTSSSSRRNSSTPSNIVTSGPSRFQVIKELGKGAFAKVYKVRRLEDGKEYALKQVDVGAMKKKEVQDAFNEIRILCTFGQKHKHPRLVRLYETFLNSNETRLSIVMEFCACGDLSEKVERYKQRRTYIDERVIWVYLIQISEGLKGLHQMDILHRDLKAANCFLAEDGSIKIGDMNVSKVLHHTSDANTQIGTPYYMAPEIWKCRPYDAGVDIWALGCLIFELCSLRPPFLAQSLNELKGKVLAGRYPRIPKTYSDDLQNVISRLLDVNPANRPSAIEILAFPEVDRRKMLVKNAMTEEWVAPKEVLKTLKIHRKENSSNTTLPQLPPAQYDDDDEEEDDGEEEQKRERNEPLVNSSTSSSTRPSHRSSLDSQRRNSIGREIEEQKEEKEDDVEEGKDDKERNIRRNSLTKESSHSSNPSGGRRSSINPVKGQELKNERRSSVQNSSNSDTNQKERRGSFFNINFSSLRPRASSVENNNNNNGVHPRRSSKGNNELAPAMVNGAGGAGKRRDSVNSIPGERRNSYGLDGR